MVKHRNIYTTKSRYINTITFGLVALTLFSGGFLMSSSTSAEDIVDEINITVPVSCSLSGTGMTSHTATIENGRYVPDIGTTTLKAFCNDNNGFAIYATGYTGDVIGQENSNKLVGTPSTIGNISTGTATSGDTSNWSMKLATTSTPTPTYPITIDNSFNAYKEVPNEYTKVAHRDSSTDIGENAEGATLTTTYASYISKTQAAGAYSGKVIYTLVHPSNEEPLSPQPAKPGKIVYHPNTSSVVGTMGDQDATNSAETILWASNFKRTGYGFAGWNDRYDYSGINYGPNQTITAPADVETNGLSLYAVWIKSAGTIQNWYGCSSLAQGSTTALTDERDGNTYAVAKLADGKCWTIENLRLADKDSSNNDIELSSTNTHNPSLPITNIYNADSSQATTSNHLSATTDPTTTAWCASNSAACDDQSMLATNNTTLFTGNTSTNYSASSNVYSYGNYYNWYSATAGHGKYGSSYGLGYTAPGDICPAGWHIPTGKDATGDFGVLDIALGGTGAYSSSSTTPTGATMSLAYRSYPNNFVYSGYVSGSSVNSRSSSCYYWSAFGGNNNGAFSMYFSSSNVRPGTNNYNKYYGGLVRCVSGV